MPTIFPAALLQYEKMIVAAIGFSWGLLRTTVVETQGAEFLAHQHLCIFSSCRSFFGAFLEALSWARDSIAGDKDDAVAILTTAGLVVYAVLDVAIWK